MLLSLSSSSNSLCSFSGEESKMYFSLENWAEDSRELASGLKPSSLFSPNPSLPQVSCFHPRTLGKLRHQKGPQLFESPAQQE